jgi:hypothetical protein
MRQIKTFSDSRLDIMCSYCGEFPDTKDHVPSKILLDEPFPENLPVVPCCNKCNQSFSSDEVYIACLIECILSQSAKVKDIKREKIKKILDANEGLRKKIEQSIIENDDQISFKVEPNRLENVILKLAKGHAKYENSEPMLEDPKHLAFLPLHLMTEQETNVFLSNIEINKSPEVGSRAMQNLLIDSKDNFYSHWITVQENNYSYCVCSNLGSLSVRIILMDYLAIEVIWGD